MSSPTLLAWCAENRIRIDARIQIQCERGLSVHSRDEWIECACSLVYIPKTVVLSVRSCFLSRRLTSVPYGHGAHLSLALALYGELLRGKHSRWSGYLNSLPRETVDIAIFWGAHNVFETRECTCSLRGSLSAGVPSTPQCPWCVRVYDNQNARQWLHVTEADRDQVGLMEEVQQYYHDVVEPTFRAISTTEDDPLASSDPDGPVDSTLSDPWISFSGYCHAYSLVSTRAFWVDAYHGLAMVPIADAFNHTNENHVQMESDYDVCIECGSLIECEHDREMGNSTVPPSDLSGVHPLSHDATPTSDVVDYLEMRTVRAVPPRSEVFNTYGFLSNAALLSRYGFTLAENEHDTVRMVLDPLSVAQHLLQNVGLDHDTVGEDNAVMGASAFGCVAIRNTSRGVDNECTYSTCGSVVGKRGTYAWENMTHQFLRVFAYVADAWRREAAWDDDELVFNPPPHARPVSFHIADVPVQISHDLVINADGKLSHHLWLFCILVASFAARAQLGASFEELVERGPGAIGSLEEFKTRLINVQGCVERLHGGSVDGDVQGDDNQGSTLPCLFHGARPSALDLDYGTESDEEIAQPAATARGSAITLTGMGALGSKPCGASEATTTLDGPLETRQDPAMRASCAPISQESRRARDPLPSYHTQLEEIQGSYGEAFPSSYVDRTSGYQREPSPSAEGERHRKRVRRSSGSTVANRNSGETDRLGTNTPGFARGGGDLLARVLARTVVCLCRTRYRPPIVCLDERGAGKTAAELGEVLDDVPEWMPRTRRSVYLAMSERSVVESCGAEWAAILGGLTREVM